jgi:hypothetical protein
MAFLPTQRQRNQWFSRHACSHRLLVAGDDTADVDNDDDTAADDDGDDTADDDAADDDDNDGDDDIDDDAAADEDNDGTVVTMVARQL